MKFSNFPLIKRIIPSLRKNIRLIFGKHIFWTEIDSISYLLDIRQKQDREFYFKKKYEEDNFNFLYNNDFFNEPFIFIDIGCNIGIYTLIIGKKFNNCKKIISIEPILDAFNILKSNINKNKIDNITSAINIALSNKDGKNRMKSFSKHNQTQLSKFEINENGNIEVNTKVFDNLFSFKGEYIYIKCDAEGHEDKILEGMQKTLLNNNCLIQLEIYEKKYDKTKDILRKFKYKKIAATNEKDTYFFAKSH
tara:strand:+ start:103 stop:852 length:750 start_codon:yes stop_codon:yes gene_type:complete